MKTLIFSDTHATDRPNSAQLAVLKKVISAADRVIINGDFWDSYITTFEKFMNSGWKEIFPLLKQRKTIYLVGNHDGRDKISDRWSEFADRLEDRIELKIGKNVFNVEHGHAIAYSFNGYYPRLTSWFGKFYPYLDNIEEGGHFLTPMYRAYMRKLHDDRELVEFASNNVKKNHWWIFGHTHLQRFSPREQYINPGSFRIGTANWLVIDEHGKVKLYSKKYA